MQKFCFILLFLTQIALPAFIGAEEVPRAILALYDSQRGQLPAQNAIHKNAEVILNYLGCTLDYHDIHETLPSASEMTRYRGILTWFQTDEMENPEIYLDWAAAQMAAGRKFVVLGNVGALIDARTKAEIQGPSLERFCGLLGMEVGDVPGTNDITRIEVAYKQPELVEFERRLDYEISFYEHFRMTDPDGTVYLRLSCTDQLNSDSDVVFVTRTGAFATDPYIVYENDETYRRKWRLNPFEFFTRAFDLGDLPKPDPNTLNGRRIWTSHIDGDAFISKSQFSSQNYCAEVIRDEILKKYQWPISVSVVVAEIESGPQFPDIARSIFALPWVEAASHSFAHPFYWADDYEYKDKYEQRHLPVPGYSYDARQEVVGSVEYINEKLLPAGKRVQAFFWTGNCEPTAEALSYCEMIDLPNINGGDTIFDNLRESYTSVAPFGAMVGGYRQLYAAHSNENIYTNNWSGPFYGFRHVLLSMQNTEAPYRIKPIDIYYHFYSGERVASLDALKQVLEETTSQPVAPVFISEYIAMVNGFYSARLERADADVWRISNYGACRTVRFDRQGCVVDLDRSSNVLGYYRQGSVLYVHLGGQGSAIVALTKTPTERVYLEQASHQIERWNASETEISFVTGGYGNGEFSIANLAANRKYTVNINGATRENQIVRTDDFGTLHFSLPMRGTIEVHIELQQQL